MARRPLLVHLSLSEAFELAGPWTVAKELARDRMNAKAARESVWEAAKQQNDTWFANFVEAVRVLGLDAELGL